MSADAGDPRRRRRARLLGAEPRAQPARARRRRGRVRLRPAPRTRSSEIGRRYPAVDARRALRRPARRPDDRGGRDRDARLDALRARARGARGRQARLRREAARRVVGRGTRPDRRSPSERGLVLMPGHTFLYSPPVNMIRDLIDSGELGEIYFISTSRVNLGLHQPDVSVAWDLGPHDFSILRYWLDETPRTSARTEPRLRDARHARRRVHQPRVRRRARSRTSSCPGSRRASSAGRRSSAREKMVVYDDTSNEPVRVFDSGVDARRPGDASASTGSPTAPATSSRRRSMRPSRCCSSWRTSAAHPHGGDAALVGASSGSRSCG